MATTVYELELVAEQEDQSSAVIMDVSVYTGENRSDKANFLAVSKNDASGNATYLGSIDNTQPLTAIQWTFLTALDGWYQFNLIRLGLYSSSPIVTQAEIKDGQGVITQYATVVFHTPTGQVVKAKTTGTITVQPGQTGWQTYWEVISDYSVLVGYGTINVLQWGDLIDCYLRDGLRDGLDAINSKPWFSETQNRVKLYELYFQFNSDVNGLQALNADGRFSEMEESVRQYTKKYL